MELSNIIFTTIVLFFYYFFNKILLSIFIKSENNLLNDNQFKNPQAFHEIPTYRLGGLTIFIFLNLVFLYLFIYQKIIFLEYITFCTLFFLLGFMDDLKINVAPKFRLLLMAFFLLILIIFNEFSMKRISLEYLENLMQIDIFALFFICLCFLFIINGANLIDGFNGLLGIHTFIILSVLFFVNLSHGNYNIAYVLLNISLIILIFIKFNFPKAQMFLGDGGAYLLGTIISISTITTNNSSSSISSFFFAILVFYLFFEVFFSFFRKTFFTHKNPLLPDRKHLHMLLYQFLLKKNKNKLYSNYKVSVYINLVYLILMIPGFIFMNNGLFCKYYFFLLAIVYVVFYKMLYTRVKEDI